MSENTKPKEGAAASNNVGPAIVHPASCKDLHRFNCDYDKWFKSLQGHHAGKLDPADPRWTQAYDNGTIPCTALSDLGIQPTP